MAAEAQGQMSSQPCLDHTLVLPAQEGQKWSWGPRKPGDGPPCGLHAIPEMLRRGSESWATERRGSRHKLLHRATGSGSGEKAVKDGVSADQRRSSLGC